MSMTTDFPVSLSTVCVCYRHTDTSRQLCMTKRPLSDIIRGLTNHADLYPSDANQVYTCTPVDGGKSFDFTI